MSLVGHYIADTGVTYNGSSEVSTWADQSGSGNDLTQLTATNKPTFQNDVVGGNPAIKFSGNEWLEAANNTIFDFDSVAFSHVIVLKNNYVSNGYPNVLQKGGSSWAAVGWRFSIYQNDGARNTLATVGDGSAYKYKYGPFGSAPLGQALISTVTTDPTEAPLYNWIDGEAIVSTVDNILASNTNTDIFSVGGANGNLSSAFFEGHVAEIRIYDHVLSTVERDSIYLELNTKYKPQTQLSLSNKRAINRFSKISLMSERNIERRFQISLPSKRNVFVQKQYKVIATNTTLGTVTELSSDLSDVALLDGHYQFNVLVSDGYWIKARQHKTFNAVIEGGVVKNQGLPSIINFEAEIKNGRTYLSWSVSGSEDSSKYQFVLTRSSQPATEYLISGNKKTWFINQTDTETFVVSTIDLVSNDRGPDATLIVTWNSTLPNSPPNQFI